MAASGTTAVNVAAPSIQERLHASLTQLVWIIDGYVLAFASLLLLAGGLAERFGAKRVYLSGMTIFWFASLASALAPSGGTLVAARVVQGAGAALFMPSSLSLLVLSFPHKRERTRMIGLWSAVIATATGLGPSLGGIMVDAFGWRSIFLLNLPIGALGMLLTTRHVTPVTGRAMRLAVCGHGAFVLVLAALSFALIEGPRLSWTAAPVLGACLVVVAGAALLAVRERGIAHPVMPWALFRDRGFSGANLVGFLFNFGFYGTLFLLGLFFQHARGATPLQAGLETLPLTAFTPLANLVYSRISSRFGNGRLLVIFLLPAAAGTLTMTMVSPATPYWTVALAIGAGNIGAGVVSPGMTAALMDAAGPPHGRFGTATRGGTRPRHTAARTDRRADIRLNKIVFALGPLRGPVMARCSRPARARCGRAWKTRGPWNRGSRVLTNRSATCSGTGRGWSTPVGRRLVTEGWCHMPGEVCAETSPVSGEIGRARTWDSTVPTTSPKFTEAP